MNENIDLTKILEGCPLGTEFYSPLFGVVRFYKIDDNTDTVIVQAKNNQQYCFSFKFTAKGYYYDDFKDAECLLFPSKNQRDWSKFERFWDKPKVEKFDPKTLQPFDKILVRNSNCNSWVCDLFSYIKINTRTNKPCLPCFYPIVGLSLSSGYCVPYNEETKHLLGTKEDCPEYYKWWEE